MFLNVLKNNPINSLRSNLVKFLIKIEDAINRFIEILLIKLEASTPEFVFLFMAYLAHLPANIKQKVQNYIPKLRIQGLKVIGYSQHYVTIIRGYLMSGVMYLRSEEFKKADKKELMLGPFRFIKFHPAKALSIIFTLSLLGSATIIIFQNTAKIVSGAKALRKPASMQDAQEDLYIEFKSHQFDVKIGSSGGGHGASPEEAHEYALFLDIKIEAINEKEKAFMETMEEMLDDNLEALELSISGLPLSSESQKQLEETITKSLNADFKRIGHENPIKAISLKQVMQKRPAYYRQEERIFSIQDFNLQIFLEDTHRNRQVWIDFSILASNRNVVLYLKDHEVELRDHMATNVEPIIPQLPIEEEGRLIIKDKIRIEIDAFLQKNSIEGKVLEVYIDYLMSS